MATIVQNAIRHELAGQDVPGHVVEVGDGAIQLPEGLSLNTANFDRIGSSLSISGPNGELMVVRGYFAQESPAELVSLDGSRMSGELASHLAGPKAPGQVAQLGPTATAESIGSVQNVSGTAVAVRVDGTRVVLRSGDPVFQGDLLETAADGAIGIVLADETALSIGANGRMVLDEMICDPATQEGSLALSVVQGIFTFLSGRIAKTDPDAMHIDTPVATIGIRGTQVGIEIGLDGKVHVVLMAEADGFVGEVVV